MTAAISLGGASPHLGLRHGDKGGKDAEDGGQRFSDAVMKMPTKPQRNDAGAHERIMDQRPTWKIGDLGKTGIVAADALQVPKGQTAAETALLSSSEEGAAQDGEVPTDGADEAANNDTPSGREQPAGDTLSALLPPIEKTTNIDLAATSAELEGSMLQNAAGDAEAAASADQDGGDAARIVSDQAASDTKGKTAASAQSQFAALVQQAAAQRSTQQRDVDPGAASTNDDGTAPEGGKPAIRGAGENAVSSLAAPIDLKDGGTASRSAATAQAQVGARETAAQTSNVAPTSSDAARTDKTASGALDAPPPRVAADADNAQSGPKDAVAARVNVVSFQSAPAPASIAAQVISPTGAGLVDNLASDPSWQAAARAAEAAATQRGASATAGTSSLRIQLQPLELGMVTAKLTTSGAQLSVEIQVESLEAHQRLSSDSDQIIKALRAVGFEVDRVTIQQAQPNNGSAMAQGGSGRDQASANPQAQGDGDARRQGERGGNAQDGQGARHGTGDAAQDAGRGGVYI